MSTATPAPQISEAQHGAKAHTDGGWGRADVPVQTRSDRFSSNDPAHHPDVTGREFEWKFTPVPLVRDLIDGELDGSAYPYVSTRATASRSSGSLQTTHASDQRERQKRSHLPTPGTAQSTPSRSPSRVQSPSRRTSRARRSAPRLVRRTPSSPRRRAAQVLLCCRTRATQH